jgi:hypothetical protein
MAIERDVALAFQSRREVKKQDEKLKDKALHRAVDDVLDGSVESCAHAAKARGVSAEKVKAAVDAELARRAAEKAGSR